MTWRDISARGGGYTRVSRNNAFRQRLRPVVRAVAALPAYLPFKCLILPPRHGTGIRSHAGRDLHGGRTPHLLPWCRRCAHPTQREGTLTSSHTLVWTARTCAFARFYRNRADNTGQIKLSLPSLLQRDCVSLKPSLFLNTPEEHAGWPRLPPGATRRRPSPAPLLPLDRTGKNIHSPALTHCTHCCSCAYHMPPCRLCCLFSLSVWPFSLFRLMPLPWANPP